MADNNNDETRPPQDWEAKHKHAGLHQTFIGSTQQSAIAANATATIALTVGLAMASFSGLQSGKEAIVLIAVIGWFILAAGLTASFARSALRIRATYEAEHASLFAGSTPYRLESFLLDFADRHRFLFRTRA